MANLIGVFSMVALLSFMLYRQCFRARNARRLPPGPKPLPFVGNIKDFPPRGVPGHQHWFKHKDIYGPISSVTVMGQTLVTIHDKQAALDLLENKSSRSSARPKMEFAGNLCGFGALQVSEAYDDTFRRRRKLMRQHFGTKNLVSRFSHVVEEEARRFLLRVSKEPQNTIKHLETEAAAIILNMVYGYSVQQDRSDPLVDLIRRMLANLLLAYAPGTWLVDVFPVLKHLPDGFPGAAFKRTARWWKEVNRMTVDIPYSFVQKQMASSSHRSSFVSNMIQQNNKESILGRDEEDDIKWTAATVYAAGADTTASSLSFFILAMAMFPEVQRKAQSEIDRVTGTDRLPGYEDREKLPYVDGVVKETLRWQPVFPMGLPHVMDKEDVYHGHAIPKGAILLPAIWWFCHDPEVYTDPDAYDPERYLEPRNESDPRNAVFGYGRRKCPGLHLADSSLFLTIAQTLAALNIGRAVDEQGAEVEAKLEVSSGVIARPRPFAYRIVPRNSKLVDVVRNTELWQPTGTGDAASLDDVSSFLHC